MVKKLFAIALTAAILVGGIMLKRNISNLDFSGIFGKEKAPDALTLQELEKALEERQETFIVRESEWNHETYGFEHAVHPDAGYGCLL